MSFSAVAALLGFFFVAYIFLYFAETRASRTRGLALLSLLFTAALFYDGRIFQWAEFLLCLGTMALSYGVLRWAHAREHRYRWALATPLLLLLVVKTHGIPAFLGVSYLTFRLAYLVYEVFRRAVPLPSATEYFGFALFPLTFVLGPISPFDYYRRSLRSEAGDFSLGRTLSRLAVGVVKLGLFAPACEKMGFSGFWLNGYQHDGVDFVLCSFFSYLLLYTSFSGACDLFVGSSALLGIRIKENFDTPLLARNIAEFWRRFHISLSDFLKEIFFVPGSVVLVRAMGPRFSSLATALALLATFFLVGLWHGTGRNFVMLGIVHAGAMALFFVYASLWKGFPAPVRRATQSLPGRIVSVALTMAFVSVTSLFFSMRWAQLDEFFVAFFRRL